ncbi:NADPH:quinone reductase [Subtercola sp. YIM 133946]|uniref:NADPH:quinone reductase n=1 Tax=Subtercola sp. YIM 133946 TaxID=3118909 RepID=UPI002F94320A
MMRAAWIAERGPASSIRVSEVPVPTLEAGELFVRVEAAAVDPVDTLVRSGRYATPIPFPFIVGRDLVGTVEAVAPDAAGFAPGDRVWCNSLGHAGRQGVTAEYACVPADRAYPLMPQVDAVRAVSLLHPLATAHLALFTHGGLTPNRSAGDAASSGATQTVVVAGGAGNVGSALVALASEAGARVIATASATDASYVAGLGATAVVDYRSTDWLEHIVRLTPEGASVSIDTSGSVGIEWALSAARPRGRIVVLAGFGQTFPLPVGALYTRDITITGFAISTASVAELAAAAGTVNRILVDTDFSARRVETVGLADVARVHEQIERRQAGSTRFVVIP